VNNKAKDIIPNGIAHRAFLACCKEPAEYRGAELTLPVIVTSGYNKDVYWFRVVAARHSKAQCGILVVLSAVPKFEKITNGSKE